MKRAAFPTISGAIVAQATTDPCEAPSIQVMSACQWINLSAEDIAAMKDAIAFIEAESRKGGA